MNYLTFQSQFHALVLSGAKVTTIRGSSKVKPGERFALRYWTGRPYGSKQGTLGTATCLDVEPIEIHCSLDIISKRTSLKIIGDLGECTPGETEAIARSDGFESAASMLQWFTDHHELPLRGKLITWADFKAAP